MSPTTVLLIVAGSWMTGYMLRWVLDQYAHRRGKSLVVGERTLDVYNKKQRREETP